MKLIRTRQFANGFVHALETHDGYPVEVTDTFLPYYTKDATGPHQNKLTSADLGSRAERWMIGVSVMSGCPVGCRFCATGQLKRWRRLNATEIAQQVHFALDRHPDMNPTRSAEFKVNYTRMGEPFLNLANVALAVGYIYGAVPNAHHYVSTIGIQGSDFSWIRGKITLQLSVHSLDEQRRHELIPWPKLMTLEEMGQIRTASDLKTTVNLTLVDQQDFDIEKLKRYFDPEHFFIKLSPINPNAVSEANQCGAGIIQGRNLV